MSTTPLRSTKPKIGWKIGKGGKANKKQEDQPQKKKKGQSEQRDTLQDEKGGKSNSNKQESPRKETKPKSSFDIKNKLPLGKSSPLLMHRKTDDSSSESDRDLVLSMPVTENSVFYMSITEDDKNKASSYKDTISSRTPPSVGVHDNLVGESLSDHFSDDFTKPFILLSQVRFSSAKEKFCIELLFMAKQSPDTT